MPDHNQIMKECDEASDLARKIMQELAQHPAAVVSATLVCMMAVFIASHTPEAAQDALLQLQMKGIRGLVDHYNKFPDGDETPSTH